MLLIVQLAITAGIFYAISHFTPAQHPLLAALLAIGILVLVRMLITANNFRLAWRFRSDTPAPYRIDCRQAWRLYLDEFKSTMLSSSWSMPFFSFTKRDVPGTKYLPVLLIHGYGCNSGYWHQMSQKLSDAKITHHAVNLEPIFGDIDHFVPAVHQAVETLCRETGHERIIIVAHSMGGLIARAYMCRHGDHRIAKVITLGTPHHGTGLAQFGLGDNSMQMRWLETDQDNSQNVWLHKLCTTENPERYALFVSIFSHHDNIIAPQTSAHLDGARNIALHGIGHVALALNPLVQKLVIDEIIATRLPSNRMTAEMRA